MTAATAGPARCARYGAAVMFIAGEGVVFLVGALRGVPIERLWGPIVWGGAASLALGWAVGHTAGRLIGEARSRQADREEKKSED